MNKILKKRIDEKWDYLPLCEDYYCLLFIACGKFHIGRDTARNVTGGFTYAQWHDYLKG